MSDFKIKEDTSWLDNLRVIATISFILLHVAAPLLLRYTNLSSLNWSIANFYDSLVRFCVPVFVMITGALLLTKDYELGNYFKKRVARIIYPSLFWMIIYSIHALLILKNGFKLPFFDMLTISSSKFGYKTTYHFWYVYMIIGLYLLIPLLSKLIRNATQKEILYFLTIWFLVVSLAHPIFNDYLPTFNLKYFGGFVGYLILGYYLSSKNFANTKNIRIISLSIFLFGVLLTALGTYFLSTYKGHFTADLYTYFSPNIIIAAISLFLFIKHINITNNKLLSVRSKINKHSFGIYFVHVLVLFWLNRFGLNGATFGPAIGIPLTTLACLTISSSLIYLLKKLGLAKVVG
ncbi:MAG: hypothetical protein EOP00_25350 [Pedobacter sp.]|nr:MAG: hypothetical protein EOP00_25350 [Pedobacter sp.]